MSMQNHDKIVKRFAELDEQIRILPVTSRAHSPSYYEKADWQQWATSVLSLVHRIFGDDSQHFINMRAAYERCDGTDYTVKAMIGVFRAAKVDFEGGYLFEIESSVSSEIFGDFVALAKTALGEGSKDVAAVLACAALEDSLKRYAAMRGLAVNDKVMQEVVSALKTKGLVGGAQKSLLDTMPKIRDYAMHANWGKITEQDVGSVIGFVEQFLLTHFSTENG